MLYTPDIYRILLLMSIVPVGANIVAISTELNVHPEKAAFVVVFTTPISLIYIPVFISLFM
jgi:predicted permease